METIESLVCTNGDQVFIRILCDPGIDIPLSSDNANSVKSAFSMLLQRLKAGPFEITLRGGENNLFQQVAEEYIMQLNAEIAEIFQQMHQLGLTIVEEDES